MIEISARLLGNSIHLPGENIDCIVTFLNISDTNNKDKGNFINGSPEILAWASAQIHCLCTIHPKINFKSDPVTPTTPALNRKESVTTENVELLEGKPVTSFAPCNNEGEIVLSTKAKILFCDLPLLPGVSKSYRYTEVLPSDAPPSYRGNLIKYSYKITIGTQRLNCPIKLLRIPLKIMCVAGLPDISNICEDSIDLTPNNPFLEMKEEREPEVHTALKMLQHITARRNPNFYNITNAKGKIARFCIFKNSYKLGEDIVGTFDFSNSNVPCVQYLVTLQSEEKIIKETVSNKTESSIKSYSKHHELCLGFKQTYLNLTIPLFVTPAFTTDYISLTWKLHFEFVTGQPGVLEIAADDDEEFEWTAPNQINIETMIWDLPVQIYPTFPNQETTPQPLFTTSF